MRADCSDIFGELETWYGRENGRYLALVIREATKDLLDRAFGYHILQLGVRGGEPLCEGSPINHRLFCAGNLDRGVNLVADPGELPLDSDSVDAVILHHGLEFASNPHEVLREVQRVLTPQGQLLIVGFNPHSLFGAKARVRRLMRDPLWSRHRPLSEHRLTDWLHLLGCEVLDTRRVYGLPPLGKGRLRNLVTRLDAWTSHHNLPWGGVYVLHATKKVAGLNKPRRMRLLRRRGLVGLVPKPAPSPAPRSGYSRQQQACRGNVAA